MPKILFYHLGAFSESEGTGNVALSIARRLKGFDVAYLSPGNLKKILFYSFLSPLWFAKNVSEQKPQIVFAVTPEAAFDALVARKIFGFNYKVLVLFHGTNKGYREALYSEQKKGIAPRNFIFETNLLINEFRFGFAKIADAATCVSKFVKAEVKKYYGIDAQHIPNGFGSESVKTQSDNGNAILFVGNAYWLKGLYYLVAANKMLHNRRKIVAVGIDQNQQTELSKLIDCSAVEFRGVLQREQLENIYSECSVFAMPSLYEGFGLSYLEALAHGIPVIGCLGTGAEDIVKNANNGVLVEKADAEGIRNALRYIEKNYTKIKKNCRVEEKFLWDNIIPKYQSVLDSLAGGK